MPATDPRVTVLRELARRLSVRELADVLGVSKTKAGDLVADLGERAPTLDRWGLHELSALIGWEARELGTAELLDALRGQAPEPDPEADERARIEAAIADAARAVAAMADAIRGDGRVDKPEARTLVELVPIATQALHRVARLCRRKLTP